MKKILLFVFFLLFITILFLWDNEQTGFWLDSENRNFLIREGVTWLNQFAFILDFLKVYRYPIALLGFSYFLYSFYTRWKRKKIANKSIFNGGKVIFDANAILSKESLPESEKKREKARKDGPSLIKKSDKKEVELPKETPNEEDLSTQTMQKILDTK